MNPVLITLTTLLLSIAAFAGEFRNLDFEEVQTNNLYYGWGATSDILPGWEVFGPVWDEDYQPSLGPIDWIGFNHMPLSTGWASIFDRAGLERMSYGIIPAMHGNYLLGVCPDGKSFPYVLAQTGTVPEDAGMLRFWSDKPFELKINEQVLITGQEHAPDGLWWPGEVSADVSAWAGQEVTLTLTTAGQTPFDPWLLIDNIRFEPIPEADVGVMIALGGLVVWWWRRRSALTGSDARRCA